jgi:hypothetical protein
MMSTFASTFLTNTAHSDLWYADSTATDLEHMMYGLGWFTKFAPIVEGEWLANFPFHLNFKSSSKPSTSGSHNSSNHFQGSDSGIPYQESMYFFTDSFSPSTATENGPETSLIDFRPSTTTSSVS